MNYPMRRTGFAIKVFLLGMTLAAPWMAFSIYEHVAKPVSGPLANVLFFLFAIYSLVVLGILWKMTHDTFFTLANLVRAIRNGDYSQRAAESSPGDPLGALKDEINQLADALQQNRLATTENDFLIQNLIDKLEMAVLILDEGHTLAMANPAFSRLYDKPLSELMGLTPDELGLKDTLAGENGPTHWINFPSRGSRYLLHNTEFRQNGRARTLYLFTDLKNPLREEERTAWKRLIRVMGHELNNSLTPIISLTNSLKNRIPASGMNAESAADYGEALDIVSSRATHLSNFVQSYSQLAKLPEPKRESVPLGKLVSRVANLENNSRIVVADDAECSIYADPAQIENLFINVIKNAMEAMGEGQGKVRIGWKRQATEVSVWVDDEGPGLAGTENLFVPFFSTKQNGNGIGLIFCREIAEANGGSIELANRAEGGCRALIVLPLAEPVVSD
jgi:two-component system, NtrC family, nitrogen regulation sensor histidine kinase NtrY